MRQFRLHDGRTYRIDSPEYHVEPRTHLPAVLVAAGSTVRAASAISSESLAELLTVQEATTLASPTEEETASGERETRAPNTPVQSHRPPGQNEPKTESEADTDSSTTDVPVELSPAAWQAKWEVDQLAWPSTVDEIIDSDRRGFVNAAKLLKATADGGSKTIAVLGASSSAGTTTVSLCLTKSLLAQGQRVTLVDAHLTHPDLGKELRLGARTGWEQVLLGDASAADVAVSAVEEPVVVLPLRASVDDPLTSEQRRRAAETFGELRELSDVTLVDSGSIELNTDELRINGTLQDGTVDAVVIVRDPKETGDIELSKLLGQLQAMHLEPIGVIDNFTATNGRKPLAAAA